MNILKNQKINIAILMLILLFPVPLDLQSSELEYKDL
jgi:hypothetical protein